MQDSYVRELMTTVKCPSCGERYLFENINVLGHQDELWFVSVLCVICENQGFVAAVIKDSEDGEVTVEGYEARQDSGAIGETVNSDDLLDMHDFLKGFDGDFISLFDRDSDGSD